jgi:hypothetical protein
MLGFAVAASRDIAGIDFSTRQAEIWQIQVYM